MRWAAPEPAEPWQGVFDASKFGAACAQSPDLSFADALSEDCLFLNVWAPAAKSSKPLPVIVFLHGGGYVSGAANLYGGKGLAEAGPAVVVSLNYRLGALGFFAHPALDKERASAPSGSDGIRDQQLALRWVHDNIAAFGGDPANVTLMGESAGAGSVAVHMVSPGSAGLARRFILESGAATKSAAGALEPLSRTQMYATTSRMAADLCPGAADVMACLRGLPADQVMAWQPPADPTKADGSGLVWVPVIEGAGGVLLEHPELTLSSGRYNRGEILIGTNINEYALFQILPSIFSLDDFKNQVAKQFAARADEIVALYQPQANTDPNQAFVTLMSDIMFRCPARRLARMVQKQGDSVFLYSFDHDGAAHAAELQYVLGPENMVGPELASLGLWPATLVNAMQRYWTRFAYKGDPNESPLPAWPRYDATSDQHMVLNDPPSLASGLQKAACDYWDRFVEAR